MTDSAPPRKLDGKALRRALGSFATGVAVITTGHDGNDRGVTVNSFTSVSLDPPLVLWCLARTSRTFEAFSEGEYFAINILAADQVQISNRFAFRSDEAFPDDVLFTRSDEGTPLLDGACAHFQCRRHSIADGGDHIVLIGEVMDFASADYPGLVYSRGSYAVAHTHPQVVTGSPEKAETGFLESTLRPTLDEITRSFESLFDAELSDEAVNSRESQILGFMLSNDRLSSEEIANKTLVSGSFLEETLQSLRDKGLIHDQGACYSLTDTGRAEATSWIERLREYRKNALGTLSPKETEDLQFTLQRLSDWVASASPRPGAD